MEHKNLYTKHSVFIAPDAHSAYFTQYSRDLKRKTSHKDNYKDLYERTNRQTQRETWCIIKNILKYALSREMDIIYCALSRHAKKKKKVPACQYHIHSCYEVSNLTTSTSLPYPTACCVQVGKVSSLPYPTACCVQVGNVSSPNSVYAQWQTPDPEPGKVIFCPRRSGSRPRHMGPYFQHIVPREEWLPDIVLSCRTRQQNVSRERGQPVFCRSKFTGPVIIVVPPVLVTCVNHFQFRRKSSTAESKGTAPVGETARAQ